MRTDRRVQVAGLALLAALIGGVAAIRPSGGLAIAAPAGDAPAKALRSVSVRKAEVKTLRRVVRLPADLVARSDAFLHARTSGVVASVAVDVGRRVESGAELLRLEVPELEAAVATARARVGRATAVVAEAKAGELGAAAAVGETQASRRLAEAEAPRLEAEKTRAIAELAVRSAVRERLEAVLARNPALVSLDAVDEARSRHGMAVADVAVAEARLASARSAVEAVGARTAAVAAQVEVWAAKVTAAAADAAAFEASLAEAVLRAGFAVVRAPFSGVVVERHVDPGDFVRDGTSSGATPLFRMLDDAVMRVRARVSDMDGAASKTGLGYRLSVDGVPGRTFSGSILRVAESFDLATRSMRVEAELENPTGLLRQGQYGRMSLDLEAHVGVVVVPAEALTTAKRKSSVLVVVDGKVVKRTIRIGADDGIEVEVTEGLAAGEAVVVRGNALVMPGEAVIAVEETRP